MLLCFPDLTGKIFIKNLIYIIPIKRLPHVKENIRIMR